MANKTVLEVEGRFDPTQILAGLKQLRSEMAKNGVNTSLFGNIDKDIAKAEKQLNEFQTMAKRGFSNEKELNGIDKAFSALDTTLGKVQNGLAKIAGDIKNFSTASPGVQKLQRDLEALVKERDKITSSAKGKVNGLVANLGISKAQQDSIVKATDDYNKLLEALKKVGAEREKSRSNAVKNYIGTNPQALNFAQGLVGKTGVEAYDKGIGSIFTKALKEGHSLEQIVKNIENLAKQTGVQFDGWEENMKTVSNLMNQAIDIAYGSSTPAGKGQITQNIKNNPNLGGTVDGRFQLNSSAQAIANSSGLQNVANLTQQITQREKELQQAVAATAAERQKDQQHAVQTSERIVNGQTQVREAYKNTVVVLRENIGAQQELEKSFGNISTLVKNVLSLSAAWNGMKRAFRETYEDIKKLDAAFGSIAMVTNKTVSELWSSYGDYAEIANKLGQSTENAIKSSALFYQQGLDTDEALSLTEDTMKLATLSGQGFEQATEQMTAALRGFHMEMSQGSHITDVYSELAANAAADVHDIAYAMSKTASIASSAGMSFEKTAAFLTNMIETTQEAPENIGTAMKTIIARFTELKENVSASESEFDDLDYNKVDKALKSVGINLKDTNGQFRNLDAVFLELSEKWSSLDRNTQRYIATIAAGSRQQSRFIAMMEDYGRTMELVETAQDSAGRSEEQFAKYADTLQNKVNALKNTWEQLRVGLMDADFFKNIVDSANDALQKVGKMDFKRLIPTTIAIMPLVKSIVTQFINGLRNSTTSLLKSGQIIGQQLGQSIASGMSSIGKSGGKLSGIAGLLSKQYAESQAIIPKIEVRIEQMRNNLNKPYLTDKQRSDLQRRLQELEGDLQAHNARMQNYAASIGESFTTIGQSVVVGIGMMFSGATFEDSLKMIRNMLIAQAAQLGIQLLAQAITTKTAIVSTTAGAMTESAAAVATGGAVMAAEGAAAGRATGEAIGNGINAGVSATGIGAIIVAVAALLAVVGTLAIKAYKNHQKNNKTLKEQASIYEEIAKQSNNVAKEAASNASTSKKEYEDAKKIKEEYEQLHSIKGRTKEQEERYAEITQQIRETMPEIVTYYDEQTGQLEVQADYWEKIVQSAKELSEVESKKSGYANAASARTNYDSAVADLRYEESQLNNRIESYKDDSVARQITEELGSWLFYDVQGKEGFQNVQTEDFKQYFEDIGMAVSDSVLNLVSQQYKSYRELYNTEDLVNENQEKINFDFVLYTEEEFEALNKQIENVTKQYEDLDKAYKKEQSVNIKNNLDRETENTDAVNTILSLNANKRDVETFSLGENLRASNMNYSILSSIMPDLVDSKTYLAWLKDASDYEKQSLENKYNAAYAERQKTNWAENVEVSSSDQKKFENFYKNNASFTDSSYKNMLNEVQEVNLELQAGYQEAIEESKKTRDMLKSQASDMFGRGEFIFKDWTNSQLEGVDQTFAKLEEKMGSGVAKVFGQMSFSLKGEQGLSVNEFSDILNSMDWSSVDLSNLDEFKEKLKEKFTGTEEEKEAWAQEWIDLAKNTGAIDLSTNVVGVEEVLNKIDEAFEKKLASQGKISKIIESQLTKGVISFSESKTLEKELAEVGMDASKYLTKNANGTTSLDVEALKQAYLDEAELGKTIIQQAIDENNAKIEQLTIELNLLTTGEDQIDINNTQIAQEKEKLKIVLTRLQAEGNWTGNVDTAIGQFSGDFKKSEDRAKRAQEIQEQIDVLNATNEELVKNKELYEQANNSGNAYAIETEENFNNMGDSAEKNAKKIEDALDKVRAAEEKLAEAQKKLNEAINGTDDYKSKLDEMYNYDVNLKKLTKDAEKAKEALQDLESANDKNGAANDYLSNVHGEIVNRKAQNVVKERAIANEKALLDGEINNYISQVNKEQGVNMDMLRDLYTEVNGRVNVNFDAINNAHVNDKFKDFVYERVDLINKLREETEDNVDAIEKKEKELKEVQKKAREDYIKLQEKVIDTLKKNHEEEIKNNEDKNKALEEADNKYLDALKKNIDKQRKLREQENAWEDLVEKQKKLSLMERDTSGSNKKEVKKLQKDVKKTQQQLLDKSVDQIVDSLKELYELQKESRENELQYQKAVLDNAALIEEANALINAWETEDDMYQWMLENTKISELTQEQLEQEMGSWSELFEAKNEYLAVTSQDFSDALLVEQNEIDSMISTTSEKLTTATSEAVTAIKNDVSELIKTAADGVKDAIKALNDARQSYNDTINAINGAVDNLNSSPPPTNPGPSIPEQLSGAAQNEKDKALKNQKDAIDNAYKPAIGTVPQESSPQKALDNLLSIAPKDIILENRGYYVDKLASAIKDSKTKKIDTNRAQAINREWVVNELKKRGIGFSVDQYGGYFKYAKGGLVSNTGPAWVDGTPSRPEAFLSAEDTERIGNAAKLLANIPLLNTNTGTPMSSNVGDTSIEIHINVDSLGSDYDVDRLAERVKQDIVSAARPTGTPIILRKAY